MLVWDADFLLWRLDKTFTASLACPHVREAGSTDNKTQLRDLSASVHRTSGKADTPSLSLNAFQYRPNTPSNSLLFLSSEPLGGSVSQPSVSAPARVKGVECVQKRLRTRVRGLPGVLPDSTIRRPLNCVEATSCASVRAIQALWLDMVSFQGGNYPTHEPA